MYKARILIVEDEPLIAQDIEFCLLDCYYETCAIVSTGEDAIIQACQLSPDLILMDIKLEGELDGIEATKQIQQNSYIPVIYLTGNSDPRTLRRSQETITQGFLFKPFEEVELCQMVKQALEHC